MLVLICKVSGRALSKTKSSYLSRRMLSKTCYREPHSKEDKTETLKAVIYHVDLYIVKPATSSNSAHRLFFKDKNKRTCYSSFC